MIGKRSNNLPEIIGANAFVSIEGVSGIPAKIDTGADSSSVNVVNLEMSPDGTLSFNLVKKSGKRISTNSYKVAMIRSSNGQEEPRYRVPLFLEIGSKRIRTTFSLSDRSRNNFPVLIGRKTLKGKFLVDVSKKEIETKKNTKTRPLNEELNKNPLKFHKKYIKSSLRNKESQ